MESTWRWHEDATRASDQRAADACAQSLAASVHALQRRRQATRSTACGWKRVGPSMTRHATAFLDKRAEMRALQKELKNTADIQRDAQAPRAPSSTASAHRDAGGGGQRELDSSEPARHRSEAPEHRCSRLSCTHVQASCLACVQMCTCACMHARASKSTTPTNGSTPHVTYMN